MAPGRGNATDHLVNGTSSPRRPAPPKGPLIKPIYGPLKSQKAGVVVTVTPLDDGHEVNGINGINGTHDVNGVKVNGEHETPKVNGIIKARPCKPPKGPLIRTVYGPLDSHDGHVFVPPPLPVIVNGVESSSKPRGPQITPIYGKLKSHSIPVTSPASHPAHPGAASTKRAPKPARGPLLQPVYGLLKSQTAVFVPPPPPPVEQVTLDRRGRPVRPAGPQLTPVFGSLKPRTEGYSPVPAKRSHEAPIPRAPLHTVSSPLALENHPIDQYPPIKAVIVGAGIAGITAGILLHAKVPGLQLVILEKNAEVGGIWNTNHYPGATADEHSDVYQSTFEPKTTWSSDSSPSAEIKEYWEALASRYGIQKKIKFNHDVTEARWCKDHSKWLVSVRSNGITRTEGADFLITATGLFKDPHHKFPGADHFLGHLRSASEWDPSFDPTGKRVALIGNDLSGIQLLPHLQKTARHVDYYQEVPNAIPGPEHDDSQESKHAPQDAKGYTKHRKGLESKSYAQFADIVAENSSSHADKEHFSHYLKENLPGRPDLQSAFQLDVSRSSTATTPYLNALTKSNVAYIKTPISHITRRGVATQDHIHHPADAIILATSLTPSSYTAAFPIYGPTDLHTSDTTSDLNAPATNLQTKWTPPHFPDTYLGLATAHYPNLFFLSGPNSLSSSSPTIHALETQATYIAKVLRKVRTQGIQTIAPSASAVHDFRAYTEAFFATTKLSEGGRAAWYNGSVPGGRVLALWPGSGVHAAIVRREPRWEDFEYTYRGGAENRFAYLGNGWAVKDVIAATLGREAAEKVGFAGYLKEEAVGWGMDLRRVHEEWWES